MPSPALFWSRVWRIITLISKSKTSSPRFRVFITFSTAFMDVLGAVAAGVQLAGTCYSFQKRLFQLTADGLSSKRQPQYYNYAGKSTGKG